MEQRTPSLFPSRGRADLEAVREISPPLDTAGDLGRADTTTTTEAMRITTLMEILRSFL